MSVKTVQAIVNGQTVLLEDMRRLLQRLVSQVTLSPDIITM